MTKDQWPTCIQLQNFVFYLFEKHKG